MNTRLVINIAKYVGAVAVGVTIGAATRPLVKDFFKIDKKAKPEMIPCEDIEEEEIPTDE